MLSFNDIFKNSFLEKVSQFSIMDTIVALAFALVIGLFIMIVYKKTFRGVMYSQSFGVSLLLMTLITTFILLAVTSNVVLSLGMVGALSIVRFRTAVKETIDVTYIFWSISAGIIIGAGLFPLAVIGSLIVGLTMILFVNKKPGDSPYILVVNCRDEDSEKRAAEITAAHCKRSQIKSKTVSAEGGIEFTLEVRLKEEATGFVNEISRAEGVRSAVLVSYNGEYNG